jgi:hypothetical protein
VDVTVQTRLACEAVGVMSRHSGATGRLAGPMWTSAGSTRPVVYVGQGLFGDTLSRVVTRNGVVRQRVTGIRWDAVFPPDGLAGQVMQFVPKTAVPLFSEILIAAARARGEWVAQADADLALLTLSAGDREQYTDAFDLWIACVAAAARRMALRANAGAVFLGGDLFRKVLKGRVAERLVEQFVSGPGADRLAGTSLYVAGVDAALDGALMAHERTIPGCMRRIDSPAKRPIPARFAGSPFLQASPGNQGEVVGRAYPRNASSVSSMALRRTS